MLLSISALSCAALCVGGCSDPGSLGYDAGGLELGSSIGDAMAAQDLSVAVALDAAIADLKCSPVTGGGGAINFDELAANTAVRDQYAQLGVIFTSEGGGPGPYVYGVFPSNGSPPNFLTGDDESVDTNPNAETGNNKPALSIILTFVSVANPQEAATTTSFSTKAVGTNLGNFARADAYDLAGTKVGSAQITGTVAAQTLSLSSVVGIHQVVVSFDKLGTGTFFEDNAGIDDVQFSAVTAACP